MFKELARNKRGTIGGTIGVLIGLLITIMVGVLVISTIISSVNTTSWSNQAKSVWTSVQSNIWVAFSLLVILPIIVGAVILLRFMGVFGGGEGGK